MLQSEDTDNRVNSLALELSEWSNALRWDDVPDAHQHLVRLWILDSLGLMFAGHDSPPGHAMLSVARRQGGAHESTTVGSGERLPAAWVALVHGTLAHSMDFDDTFPDSVVHPGSLVVPVALAVGEAMKANGSAVLGAVAAGYEVAARLGSAAGAQFHARGFQASGVVGPLVTALVAGKIYEMSAIQVAQAMGLAGSMAGGLLEFISDGSWSKRLHLGWAAHGGILAAQLAATGFPGPLSVLEGRFGLYNAFLGNDAARISDVSTELGSDWRSRKAKFKYYPCAHVIHSFLDAAISLCQLQNLQPEQISKVECRVAAWGMPIVCTPRAEKIAPQTEYQARGSLPFALAAALVDGRVDLNTFTPAAISRPELLALAVRIECVEDPCLSEFECVLHISTNEGQRFTAKSPANEKTNPQRVLAKFYSTAGRVLPRERVAAVAAAVDQLEHVGPSGLLEACRHQDRLYPRN